MSVSKRKTLLSNKLGKRANSRDKVNMLQTLERLSFRFLSEGCITVKKFLLGARIIHQVSSFDKNTCSGSSTDH